MTLTSASTLVAAALRADKVDTFLYDPARDSLVALGSSEQPLSALQRQHGLDVIQLANGGRTAWVYQTGKTYANGRVDQDTDELPGIRDALRIRSAIGVPLDVAGKRRGMLMIASQQPEHFTGDDVRFSESVSRWIGLVTHRAELVEEIARNAAAQGRRAAAEELITVFAHDMRNHISPIMTRLALLQKRTGEEHRQSLGLAIRSLQQLGAMITDILDVARIDEGLLGVNLEPVDLPALVRDVASAFSTAERPVQVQTRLPGDVVIAADPARIRQCLENLVSNGQTHSPRGAPVVVSLAQEANFARIDVIDQGPGVPREMLPKIFDRFVTGEASTGLGLGLFLGKRIAELHGGDLAVDASATKGARFVLTLPLSEHEAAK